MATRPRTLAFDVVETLMSLTPLGSRLADVGLPPALLQRWFDRTLRDGMALSNFAIVGANSTNVGNNTATATSGASTS